MMMVADVLVPLTELFHSRRSLHTAQMVDLYMIVLA